LVGKNSENFTLILRLICAALNKYAFDAAKEHKIAKILLGIQSNKNMVFVMACSVLDDEDKRFINKFIQTKGIYYVD
jgi:hypothetical protein